MGDKRLSISSAYPKRTYKSYSWNNKNIAFVVMGRIEYVDEVRFVEIDCHGEYSVCHTCGRNDGNRTYDKGKCDGEKSTSHTHEHNFSNSIPLSCLPFLLPTAHRKYHKHMRMKRKSNASLLATSFPAHTIQI